MAWCLYLEENLEGKTYPLGLFEELCLFALFATGMRSEIAGQNVGEHSEDIIRADELVLFGLW